MSETASLVRFDPALRALGWGGATALWLLPLLAGRFISSFDWSVMDYVVWGVMLLTAASVFEASLRLSPRLDYRLASWIALGAGFLLVWANLAVGIVGDEGHPLNALFFAVLIVPVVGAFVSNFRARGLSLTLFLTALAQGLAALPALALGERDVLLTGVWMAAWLISAALFRRAGVRTD